MAALAETLAHKPADNREGRICTASILIMHSGD
jgi:hypothetical protein